MSDTSVAVGRGRRSTPRGPSSRWLALLGGQQPGGLDEVVGKHPKAAPDLGTGEAVQQRAGPAEAVLELADATLAAGAPLHQPAKAPPPLDGLAGGAGAAFAGNGDPGDAQPGEVPLDGGLGGPCGSGGRRDRAG